MSRSITGISGCANQAVSQIRAKRHSDGRVAIALLAQIFLAAGDQIPPFDWVDVQRRVADARHIRSGRRSRDFPGMPIGNVRQDERQTQKGFLPVVDLRGHRSGLFVHYRPSVPCIELCDNWHPLPNVLRSLGQDRAPGRGVNPHILPIPEFHLFRLKLTVSGGFRRAVTGSCGFAAAF